MSYYIGLDPGRQGFGWAVLDSCPALVAAGVVPQPKPPHKFARTALPVIALCVVRSILDAVPDLLRRTGNRAVVERMVQYPPAPRERGKARSRATDVAIANDLLDLQALGGMVAGALVPLANITYRTAHEWKGNTDWEAIERRLLGDDSLEIARVLTLPETAILNAVRPWGLRHNAVEAAGMVLQEVERVRWV